MPVTGMRKVILRYDLPNLDQAVNVMHVRQDAPATATLAELETLAQVVEDDWWDGIRSAIAANVILNSIVVSDASGETALSFEDVVGEAGTEGTTQVLPMQLAMVLTLRTALNSRSGRGRIYQTGFTEVANTSAGFIVSTTRTDITNAMGAFITGLDTAGYALGVYSRLLDVFNPVSAVTIDSRWDIQRRRANRT